MATFNLIVLAAVGLAAVPSTVFWPYLARRIGNRWALLAAYAVQITGVLADRQDGFALPLLLAVASVTLGCLFIAADRRYPPRLSTAP